jgi:signal transduction histidine kinase
MSRITPTGREANNTSAGRDWKMEVSVGERQPLRQQVLFLYGMGAAIGLYAALIHLYFFRSLGAFFFFLGTAMVFTTGMLVLWRAVLPRFSDRPPVSRFVWHVVIAISFFATLSYLTSEINLFIFGGNSLLQPRPSGDLTVTFPAVAVRRFPLIYPLIPIVPVTALCLVGFNFYWWRIRLMQGRERELRELAIAAQLAALRAQINPHFFFNSLNSIAQLIQTDPAKAETCVERLADIFRYLLSRTQAEFVPLADELKVAEAYLDIERARFGDDLIVTEEIDDRARGVLMPGLMLQPLVENAVRHGISRKIGGGSVLIRAAIDAGSLQLTVSDTGVGIRARDTIFERGVGLRSVRDRLVKLYGAEYAPAILTAEGEGTTITLRIPVGARPQPA